LRRLWLGVAALFAAPPAGFLGAGRIALASAAVLLGTAVGLLRQPGPGALNTIWAEDGGIFLGEAARRSTVDALTTSYAGYYHLVPRLLAEVATLVPARAAAGVLAVSAALCVALVALLVYVASAGLLRSPVSRLLISAIVVLVPVGQGDVLNSIANLHWYGLYALLWVLIWTPRSRAGRIVAAVVTVLAAGSDILAVVFLPLALARAVQWPAGGQPSLDRFRLRIRDRYSALLAVLFGVGMLMQVAGLLTGSSSRKLDPNPVRAVIGYILRAVPAPLIGEQWLGTSIDARWVVLAGVAWVLVGLAVLAAWARLTRPVWPLVIAATLYSAALYMLSVALSGVATGRYAVAPAMLVVTALVALVQPAPGASSRAKVPIYGLAAVLALVCVVNARVDNTRAHGPSWSDELRAAQATCAASHPQTVDVPLSPAGEGWTATLPCTYIAPSR
jgi:hypothetical protein